MRYQLEQDIFRQASTTYYWSSRFFPKDVREDVFKLYSFVRIADDYVDNQPQRPVEFEALRHAWDVAIHEPHFDTTPITGEAIEHRVIKNMVHVYTKYAFKASWETAF